MYNFILKYILVPAVVKYQGVFVFPLILPHAPISQHTLHASCAKRSYAGTFNFQWSSVQSQKLKMEESNLGLDRTIHMETP